MSCDPGFLLEHSIGLSNQPSDFHSLCSMHTSNKNPDEDNGNKGVGFRSVFSVAPRVYVWSRLADGGGWWGILLVRELNGEAWQAARDDPLVSAGFATILPDLQMTPMADGGRRPSFHFPLPLWSNDAPVEGLDWASTIIVLPCEDEEADQSIAASMDSLCESHLEFVGLRGRSPISVNINNDLTLKTAVSEQVVSRWDVELTPGEPDPPLITAAHRVGLDVKHIGGAIRWPRPGQDAAGRVYCFLATEVPCPFGIDIHADLQTGIDRKHLDVNKSEAVGAYNRQLLLRGLDLHIKEVDARADERDDLWRFLDPGADLYNLKLDADPVRHLLAWEMAARLFFASGGKPTNLKESWRRWAELAPFSAVGRLYLGASGHGNFTLSRSRMRRWV